MTFRPLAQDLGDPVEGLGRLVGERGGTPLQESKRSRKSKLESVSCISTTMAVANAAISSSAEPASEPVVARFDRKHTLIVERLRATEGTDPSKPIFGVNAHKIPRDRRTRDAEPLGKGPLGAPHEQGHVALGQEVEDLYPAQLGSQLTHRAALGPWSSRY